MPIPPSVCFWLYFPVLIPSILCSIFVLYHLLVDRALRRALNNHVIIVILILGLVFELTDVVWLIHYYRIRIALVWAPVFCLIWVYIDVAGFITVLILVAWASVERHILIFHDSWISTRRRRIFIHYIPLIIFLLYPLIFYSFMFFFISCELPLDYTIIRCGYSYCAMYFPSLGTFDGIVNNVMPTFTIVTFSVLLLVRVLWQKRRLRQRINWRNYRKMIVQLLSISSIYLLFYFPPTIVYVAYTAGVSLSYNALDYYVSSQYFTPHIVMLIPFMCAVSLPELREKFKINVLRWRRAHAVRPERIRMNRLVTGQPIAITPIVQ